MGSQTDQDLRYQAETILAGAQRQTGAAVVQGAEAQARPRPEGGEHRDKWADPARRSPPAAPALSAPEAPAPSATPSSSLPTAPSPTPSSQKPLVYIQIQTDAARAGARTIKGVLEANGFAAPGIELLRVGPRRTEVRYFHPADKGDAESIAELLRAQKVSDVTPKLVPGQEANVRKKQFEIWFAPDAFG